MPTSSDDKDLVQRCDRAARAKRWRDGRESVGLSLREFCASSGLEKHRVRSIEAGEAEPTAIETALWVYVLVSAHDAVIEVPLLAKLEALTRPHRSEAFLEQVAQGFNLLMEDVERELKGEER